MELSVSVLAGGAAARRHVRLLVDEDSTVESARRRLAVQLDEPSELVRLILAGRELTDAQSLGSLQLGAATVVHAVVGRRAAPVDEQWAPSYYVYCKLCSGLRRAKLRVCCGSCKSTAVVLTAGPRCWDDVLRSRRLQCLCDDCHADGATAEFFFKCVGGCDSRAAPLAQVRSNVQAEHCSTCGDVLNPLVDFHCSAASHATCLDCFVAYGRVSLDERRFTWTVAGGYTLGCPAADCDGLVTDAHHFHLLGDDYYERYQHIAAETFVLRQRGSFCPATGCGAALLFDVDAEWPTLNRQLCPECGRIFCRACACVATDCSCAAAGVVPVAAADALQTSHSPQSTGSTDGQHSLRTIRQLCQPCPECRVQTQRDGGCAHMSCRQCGTQWCWICRRAWSEQCQWDHWFQ